VLFGDVRADGGFAFRVPSKKTMIRYDADRQEFSYEISPTAGANYDFDLFEVERHEISGAAFTGINQYYAEKLKPINHTENIFVRVKGMRGLTYLIGRAAVNRRDAEGLERSFEIVLVGRLRPPFASTEVKHPFEANEDTVEHRKIIEFVLTGVWLVDSRSGNVLSKTHSLKRLA
jgi:hypothetical protein